MLVHTIYFYASNNYRGVIRKNLRNNDGVSIIVPVKNEPVELIDELINALGRVCSKCELIIVSDDPEERALKIKELCDLRSKSLPSLAVRFIRGDPVKGSRVKALNRGVYESKYEYILILDVDSRPEKGFIEKLLSCIDGGYDACVGRWESYYSTNTRLAISIGRIMKFTVDSLYKGRSALNLFIFPLGSGTMFKKSSLLAVNLWDEVIQDDMYIGMKFLVNGLKISYVDDAVVRVLVPSSFDSLKIQQGRWAYGALEVLRKTYKQLIRCNISTLKKLEVVLFLGQYIPTSLFFLGSLIIPLMSIILKNDLLNYGLGLTALSGVVFVFYAIGIYKSLIGKYVKKSLVIRTMGSSAAITVSLFPTIFVGTFKSLLIRRTRYHVTPKGSYERINSIIYLLESIYLLYISIIAFLNLVAGNLFTFLWCLSIATSIIYVIIRANRLVNI